MPAVALGNRVWAWAKRMAGSRLPMNPLTASAVQVPRSHRRARRKATGASTKPATAMRSKPSCRPSRTAGEPGPPPHPNNPIFIRMKELPQIAKQHEDQNLSGRREEEEVASRLLTAPAHRG